MKLVFNSNIKVTEVYKNLYLLEDFYLNPHDVRTQALELPFDRPNDKEYISNQTNYIRQDDLKNRIAEILKVDPALEVYFHHNFNKSFEKYNDFALPNIHSDTDFNNKGEDIWLILIPLNDLFVPQGGTAFWEHKETKSRSVLEELMREIRFRSRSVVYDNMGKDLENWHPYFIADYKFNQAVLCKSDLWHSGTKGFGDSDLNCRFIQLGILSINHPV